MTASIPSSAYAFHLYIETRVSHIIKGWNQHNKRKERIEAVIAQRINRRIKGILTLQLLISVLLIVELLRLKLMLFPHLVVLLHLVKATIMENRLLIVVERRRTRTHAIESGRRSRWMTLRIAKLQRMRLVEHLSVEEVGLLLVLVQ